MQKQQALVDDGSRSGAVKASIEKEEAQIWSGRIGAREELVREREELMRERDEYRKMREEMVAYYASMRASGSGVGSTTVTASAAQHEGDGGQDEEEDDADDYQDP
ncbi:hypothetical protein PIB30_062496 [Stylosanthes scabra]|uniref:Uncharacterized protein n=1 Tax=Stylosanthes scabra TaxID=79078 RepID=A0ABU6TNJ4_9FABA|nr:hypothetical protein [Stylosanthes scabra]